MKQFLKLNNLLTAVIVDDEARNIALFSYYLEKYCPGISVVASFTKKSKAISHLKTNKPDILFLDIVLDEGSGFDLLDAIDYDDIYVVMCSAHDEFALRAIRYQVVDYLLKPLEIQDLIATVKKIQGKMKKNEDKQVYDATHFNKMNSLKAPANNRIAISEKASVDFISVDEILCVETHKGAHKTEIVLRHHNKGENIIINKTLLDMEKIMPEHVFLGLVGPQL